ncbi:vacuolar protein sorting-associated protein 26A, putative [Entamoeba invadens IP1]|uniref:Vacuolar protein sorting-associated protein 26A, putative n=1 Tax=Entamoeba invadens IP1 TaxID=370355 RepID=L7FKP1_ENTIV|nr:vacuolar protein sorting-associated protein 26A, putative [Entamoeba invadens IP1]ELP84864.1 vacuolar protein sorting-associated protein 26A, putative [Entamoeba invadens IP1]|eukprot:XP_004184210.1 vacuolar protein sorting-associated protein 26A, putative [Entamoeba invadens IP1]
MIEDDQLKPKVFVVRKNEKKELIQFGPQDSVKGKVLLQMGNLKKPLLHNGIRITMCSVFECQNNSKPVTLFETAVDLCGPGVMSSEKAMYSFEFSPITHYESYNGAYVRLRYLLRVVILAKSPIFPVEYEFAVSLPQPKDDSIYKHLPVNTQVGIEKIIQMEMKLETNTYALEDVVMGCLYLRVLRVNVSKVSVDLIRKEFVGRPPVEKNVTVLKTLELADGQLVKGDTVPVRIFLNRIKELTPTLSNVADTFSVNYYLSFVFEDEEGLKYNALVEIILIRGEKNKKDVRITPPINLIKLDDMRGAEEFFLDNKTEQEEDEEKRTAIKNENEIVKVQKEEVGLEEGQTKEEHTEQNMSQSKEKEEPKIEEKGESKVESTETIQEDNEEKLEEAYHSNDEMPTFGDDAKSDDEDTHQNTTIKETENKPIKEETEENIADKESHGNNIDDFIS